MIKSCINKLIYIFLFFHSGYGGKEKGNLAAQMLMLYYVLLYESVRLANMKSILVSPGRKVIRYSHDLLSELPIKFLLATAERDQVINWLKVFQSRYPKLV